jgi:hypothetical protein
MVLAGAVCGLPDASIREALKEARFFSVGRKAQRKARLRTGQFTAEEIAPLAALKKSLESKNSLAKTKVLLISYSYHFVNSSGFCLRLW